MKSFIFAKSCLFKHQATKKEHLTKNTNKTKISGIETMASILEKAKVKVKVGHIRKEKQ